jgi:hypothetical protein
VKNLVAFIIALLIIMAAAGFMISTQKSRADQFELDRELALLHRETMRQFALLAHSPDDKIAYDRAQAVRKHADGVKELRKKFPKELAEDAFIKNMEEKAALGEKDKAKTAEYRARYDYLKQMYEDYVKAGNYKVLFGGVSNGLRFEVVSVKKSNDGGQEGLRWDVFLTGAPVKDQLTLNNLHLDAWLEFPEKETSGKRRGQPKRSVYKADLQPFLPYVLVDKPWEWMPDWPAGLMVGYYIGIPQFDSRVTVVDMALTGQMRTLGGTAIPIEMSWKQMAVDASWKGSAGGKWDDPNIVPLSDEDLTEQGVELPEAAKK